MGLAPVEIRMKLIDEKIMLEGVSKSNPNKPIIFDYVPPLGTGNGYTGIEMLTMSFAGCVSTAIIGLLRRRGKNIRSYDMQIKGIKHEEPLSLEAIEFVATVDAEDITDEDKSEVLAIAEKISPVWIAIRGNVKVTGKLLSI